VLLLRFLFLYPSFRFTNARFSLSATYEVHGRKTTEKQHSRRTNTNAKRYADLNQKRRMVLGSCHLRKRKHAAVEIRVCAIDDSA
jgi:hypothetical protein